MNPNTGELMELRDAQVPDGFERLRGRFIERIAQQELQRARGAGHETAHVNLNSQHLLEDLPLAPGDGQVYAAVSAAAEPAAQGGEPANPWKMAQHWFNYGLKCAQEIDHANRKLRSIFNHWNEFGPEHGFGELIDRLQQNESEPQAWSCKEAARWMAEQTGPGRCVKWCGDGATCLSSAATPAPASPCASAAAMTPPSVEEVENAVGMGAGAWDTVDPKKIVAAAVKLASPAAAAVAGEPLPERDQSKMEEQQGLFRKFDVRRTDGSDRPGGKHEGCEYFVLDINHDPHATPALAAYADAVAATHPTLATDMRNRYGLYAATQPSPGAQEAVAWQGGEEWEPLAWALCAEENGEDACTDLIWEGGPQPEPWGDRWLKYEPEAKRLIALVRKHVPAPSCALRMEQERDFSEWLDTQRDKPVAEVFHDIVARYRAALTHPDATKETP